MSHNIRVSNNILLLLSLAAVVTGCQQPIINVNKPSWTEKWSEKLSNMTSPKKSASTPAPAEKVSESDEALTAAQILEHSGETDRAIAAYNEILKKDKRRTEIHHHLAALHDLNGEPDKAAKHYKEAIKKTPKDANLLCDYGYHFYLINKHADAEQQLRRAIDRQSNFARAHNNLGLVLARTGRESEALTEFKRAGLTEANAHLNLAYALLWEKKLEEAAREIDLALAAEPKSKPAQQALKSLQVAVNTVQRESQPQQVAQQSVEPVQPTAQPTVLQTNFEEQANGPQVTAGPNVVRMAEEEKSSRRTIKR